MPVLPDSAASKYTTLAANVSTGTLNVPVTVSKLATDRFAIAAIYYGDWTDATAVTCSASFDSGSGLGPTMTVLKTLSAWGGRQITKVFLLQNIPVGDQGVTFKIAGMPSSAPGVRCVIGAVSTYSGVGSADIANAVSAGGTNTVDNSVTVTSDALGASGRVVAVHAVGTVDRQPGQYFTSYNLIQRASGLWIQAGVPANVGNSLMIGDAPGAPSVTSTAKNVLATPNWNAVGIALSPSPVSAGASLKVSSIITACGGGVARVQPPSPERTWTLKGGNARNRKRWDHDMSAVLDYSVDWSNKIDDDDYIVNAVFTPTDPALSVFSHNLYPEEASTVATGWFQGGIFGQPIEVDCHITTHAGRQDTCRFSITGRRK